MNNIFLKKLNNIQGFILQRFCITVHNQYVVTLLGIAGGASLDGLEKPSFYIYDNRACFIEYI